MKEYTQRFIDYLRYERNVSPDTIVEYRRDTMQFAEFLAPPGTVAPPLSDIDHRIVGAQFESRAAVLPLPDRARAPRGGGPSPAFRPGDLRPPSGTGRPRARR